MEKQIIEADHGFINRGKPTWWRPIGIVKPGTIENGDSGTILVEGWGG